MSDRTDLPLPGAVRPPSPPRSGGEGRGEEEPRPSHLLHAVLFLVTCLTTTAQGASFRHADGALFPLADGLSFSLPLMAILVCHELGHYFTARYHGVPASLPYFIPLPPSFGLFGTMGAVIRMPPVMDRRKLMDIGAAGPLVGLAVAIPVLFYGLLLSEVKPLVGLGLQEGNSILYALLKLAAKGAWLPADGVDVILHPTAWAGWAGLLITMLNLIPVGQLDGGHVATAYFGNRYARVARFIHRSMPVLAVGVFAWVHTTVAGELGQREVRAPAGLGAFEIALNASLPWLVWSILLWALGRLTRAPDHPPVDPAPLPQSRAALFWVVLVAFGLIFMPVPLRISVGSVDVRGGPTDSLDTTP